MLQAADVRPVFLWPIAMSQRSLGPQVDGADAVVLRTRGSILPEGIFRQLAEDKVPALVLNEGMQEYGYKQRMERAEKNGAILLDVLPDQALAVVHGLQQIVTQEPQYEAAMERARTLFDSPDFFRERSFLELVIDPMLKDFVDSVPDDGLPLVVDAAHIDNREFKITDADEATIVDALQTIRYAQLRGDSKLGLLFNEVHLFDYTGSIHAARRSIVEERRNVKNTGLGFLQGNMIAQNLWAYGFAVDSSNDEITNRFEGSLMFQTRQELDRYKRGENPFQVELIGVDQGFAYVSGNGEFPRMLYSDVSGAPLCRMISAKHNQRYEQEGAGHVLFLRDIKWECAVREGARVARDLYGVTMPMSAIFYAKVDDKPEPLKLEQL